MGASSVSPVYSEVIDSGSRTEPGGCPYGDIDREVKLRTTT